MISCERTSGNKNFIDAQTVIAAIPIDESGDPSPGNDRGRPPEIGRPEFHALQPPRPWKKSHRPGDGT
jgi:hypothetical protein